MRDILYLRLYFGIAPLVEEPTCDQRECEEPNQCDPALEDIPPMETKVVIGIGWLDFRAIRKTGWIKESP